MTSPATAALAGARAAERARSTLRPPRRVSGPVRGPKAAPPARKALTRAGSPMLALLAAAERLSSHRLLDRLIRGRAWLVLVTFALIGVVTLQLALLKLNGGVGRTLQTQAQLQRENASLSIENSELAAADRVQTRAAQLGMEFASSTALRSLAANPRLDVKRAASVLSAPVRSQTPGSEEGSGRAQPARGEGSSTQSGEGVSASAQATSSAEGKPAGEASSEGGSSPEAGSTSESASGSTSASGGGEASSAGQTGAQESEATPGSAGGQGVPESGSGG